MSDDVKTTVLPNTSLKALMEYLRDKPRQSDGSAEYSLTAAEREAIIDALRQTQQPKGSPGKLAEMIAEIMDVEFGFQHEEFDTRTLPLAERIVSTVRENEPKQAFDDATLFKAAMIEWNYVTDSMGQTDEDRTEGMKRALRFLGVLK